MADLTGKLPEWENIKPMENLPTVELKDGKEHIVRFLEDIPRKAARKADLSEFFIFAVSEDNIEKQVLTSAATLFHALKAMEPLKDKVAKIQKVTEKGRTFYKVTELGKIHTQEEMVA